MKTRKLRLVSALLAVAMMLALLPTAAFAEDSTIIKYDCGKNGNNVIATLDTVTGVMTISGTGEMADYDKNPQPWANQRSSINKVVIGDNVTSIGDNAFSDCTALKNVDLSKASSLETIGNHAFSSCTALKSVDLSEASSLTTIKTSFPGCTGLENVVLNEGLVEIGGSAFNTCTSLGSIHIPSTVTAIGGYCFERCTSLSKVTFEAGSQLERIAVATFAGCKILETITIPKKVKEIQKDAFNGCGGLKSVTFEPGSELETIGDMVFRDTAISEISIPASVKTIGSYVFRCLLDEWSKLTKVIFESPSSLENVPKLTFVGCSKVTIYGDDNVMSKLSGIVAADKIKPANLTVTFVPNGGSAVSSQTVANGEKVSEPAPTRKGYKFMGWYEKIGENEYKPFDFSTAITDNITLYAQWEEVPVDTYVVTVENGVAWVEADAETEAVAAGESICVPEGVTVHVKADETALEGMTFERWEVRKGEVKLENDRAAKTSFTMPAGEVQLEAMYQAADVHDSGWDAATVVTGAVIGTGTAILAYHIGMEVYAEQVLGKGVAVPRTRGEVALLAWQLAGSPAVNVEGEPLSEAAQAERWAVESGLMQPDAEGNFNGTKKMSKWNALRVLDAAKKQG